MPCCRPSPHKFLLVFVTGVLISVAPLLSQTFYGSIVGTVTDASGAAVSGVPVALTAKEDAVYRWVTLLARIYLNPAGALVAACD